MVFKKTACILLFSACPLIAPVEAEALNSWDWNKYYSDTPDTADTKSVISSGHTGQSISEGTYNGVTFGNAYYDKIDDAVENVKSSNNEGTINSGVITKQEVYGGRAVFDIYSAQSKTVQANYNKITFKSGSTFETSNSDGLTNEDGGRYGIHGGHADLADITSNSMYFYGGDW